MANEMEKSKILSEPVRQYLCKACHTELLNANTAFIAIEWLMDGHFESVSGLLCNPREIRNSLAHWDGHVLAEVHLNGMVVEFD